MLAVPWAVARKFGDDQAVALVIGIAGTVYGSLGVGFAAQNAINTVWNIPHVHRGAAAGPRGGRGRAGDYRVLRRQ